MGGTYGLAFAKTYLEGDMRWKATLLGLDARYVQSNIPWVAGKQRRGRSVNVRCCVVLSVATAPAACGLFAEDEDRDTDAIEPAQDEGAQSERDPAKTVKAAIRRTAQPGGMRAAQRVRMRGVRRAATRRAR
jgi:hypothetical protein